MDSECEAWLESIMDSPAWAELNELDRAILRLDCEGRTYREIGEALDVTETRVAAEFTLRIDPTLQEHGPPYVRWEPPTNCDRCNQDRIEPVFDERRRLRWICGRCGWEWRWRPPYLRPVD